MGERAVEGIIFCIEELWFGLLYDVCWFVVISKNKQKGKFYDGIARRFGFRSPPSPSSKRAPVILMAVQTCNLLRKNVLHHTCPYVCMCLQYILHTYPERTRPHDVGDGFFVGFDAKGTGKEINRTRVLVFD